MEILVLAQELAKATGGAYDITSTALWEAWGFARRLGKIPDDNQLDEARRFVGIHLLELDRERLRVRLLEPGVRINLGSLGKGYALDRAAESLLAAGIEHFLVHAGASSVLARGSRGTTAAVRPGGGWGVGLPSPLRPERRLGMLRLLDRALGTSGSQAQSFWHDGKRYGHILDPRSGRPADRLLSATAVAPTAMMADALSTAFYVMGADATLEYCRARPDCGAVVFLRAQRAGGLEMRRAGLGENDLISAD
jgi:thiamine biosynthesis lipoprotein